jgi:hydrogenase maturation protein HypF
MRTFALPGGEKAVKEPRRIALTLLYEIFGPAVLSMDLPPVRAFTSSELKVLKGMLERGVNTPLTSSAGRLFDGVAALIGLRQVCRFEGQAAMELEFAAGDGAASEPYGFEIQSGDGLVIDWEPMLRAIVSGVEAPAAVARRFHATLAAIAVAVARRIGEPKVVLSGGCFQNRLLTELVIGHIQGAGMQPYWHQRVPPNDGGIALGQVVAAAHQLTRESQNHVSGSSRKDP